MGTLVAEASNSEDQSTSIDVVPDAPAEGANSEANHVSVVVEPGPPKTIFVDLPDKVPTVVDLPYFSLAGV